MEIREITEIEKDDFDRVVNHPVQSWEWGNFRTKAGNRVLRLGLFDGDRLKEAYLLTLHRIPKTKYRLAMFAKGPEPSQEMLKALRELAIRENLLFIRMEPNVTIENCKFKIENFTQPGRPFFNKSTFVIDLTKTEDELLKAMHPKTRYNIRVAQRHGVEVVEDNSPEAFERYLELMDQTTTRQKYFAHTEKYHRLMWEAFAPNGIAHLLTARYQGKIIITWIVFKWHDTLYYPYGASSDEDRNVMAAYLMMWGAIKFGKQLGCTSFDLWGRDEGKGFTRFKEGFGPKVVEFTGTWDLVINPTLYKLYRVAEETRWILLKAKTKFLPYKSNFR